MNLCSIPRAQQLLFSSLSDKVMVDEFWKYRPDLLIIDVKEENPNLEMRVSNLNNMSPLDYEIGKIVAIPSDRFVETFGV